MPAALRHGEQHRVNYYQVRRGDTLSRIAGRHRTSVSALAAANNLPSRHRIYPGQVLEIPDRNASAKRRRSLVKTAHAATKPAKPPAPPAKIVPVEGAPPSVSEDSPWRRVEEDRVLVDALETIGHFAEWLGVSASRLRKLNGLRHGSTLRMGQRIRLDFSRVSHEKFLERRMEFHKGIVEDFFGAWRVTGTVEHTLRRGESLWSVSERRYSVPVWLIHRFNPEVDLTSLTPGTALQIPVVEKIGSGG
jgi:membrane-bound lytic murein transglycosylase D